MKLDELEKVCGSKTDPIPDTCQRPVAGFNPPIMPTLPNRSLQRIPADASGKETRGCKIIKYTPNPNNPLGYDEHVEWIDIDKIDKKLQAKESKALVRSPDAHLGGVELDTPLMDHRYEYPYCQSGDHFTEEDWAGIS